jgi:hypothetical protein
MILAESALPPDVGALLRLLAAEPALRSFSLGGGTAIALRLPYRRSIDLDYFTIDTFDSLGLQVSLATAIPGFTVSNRTMGSLRVMSGSVKAEFFHHPYPLLEPVELGEGLNILSLEDLAAMKVNAVTNRGSKKDFSDLLALHEHGLALPSSLDRFCRKYGAAGRLLAVRSLLWFGDTEGEPDPFYLNGWTWPEVHGRIEAIARLLVEES